MYIKIELVVVENMYIKIKPTSIIYTHLQLRCDKETNNNKEINT